ncbi:sensor histidine kinase [Massilia sp. CF038]|uniref:sensor histidine kinase n=1 Tax=Massilia sp. CF038 TaxID=1881045 RepID=UPI0009173133|nr:sensor histidine kinase [Massilia sp. CF038]SHG74346.1 Signal transduction histidine kinase [Massilia sp. CF038]
MLTMPVMIIAFLWMLLLGWGFHALLQRHLRLDETLSERDGELQAERQARSSAERALASTHVTLCKLARQQESVREAERQRIGRDIHDDLGQHLLALKIDLSLLQVSTTGAHPQVAQKVGTMIGHLDRTIASLRSVINDLRPLALAAGLPAAIEWQLAELSRLHGIAHELKIEPHCLDGGPDAARDGAVFRILQESLSNVVRHAHASEVAVTLSRSGTVLTMTVRDNGIGMPLCRAAGGNGLAGIGERAAAIGGCVAIDSQPGSGTLLTLSFPLIPTCIAH